MNIVYLDTETTGFTPGQICELTMIHETDTTTIPYNYFFKVNEMDKGAQDVHGMSIEQLEKLSNGKVFADYKDEILGILDGATLVAHNLPFDEKFLSSEFWRTGISFKPSGRLDTMEYFKPILRIPSKYRKYGPYKNPKLSELVDYFKINTYEVEKYTRELFKSEATSYHDSRFDTTAMFVVVNIQREIMSGKRDWHFRFCS